jgi:hypothetical protein
VAGCTSSELPSLDNNAIAGVVDSSWCSVEHFDGFLRGPFLCLRRVKSEGHDEVIVATTAEKPPMLELGLGLGCRVRAQLGTSHQIASLTQATHTSLMNPAEAR